MEPHPDELLWIERAVDGDHAAFTQLVEAYKGPVYSLALRMLHRPAEAEDAAQEIFLRAYTKLATYDRERKFVSWLMGIASNYCIDVLRRRRATFVTLDDVAYIVPSTEPGPERQAEQREQRRAIQQAIAQLPETYRLVAVLRYYQDLSYEEIQEITGLSEPTVKTRLHRARRMLQESLSKEGVLPWTAEPSAHS